MALTDLHTELVKDTFKVDLDNEKKIVSKLLAMVAEDGSGDIKGLAVKWYFNIRICFICRPLFASSSPHTSTP